MSETGNGAAPATPPQIKMNVLAQFVRDMSFENILSQKGVNGEVQPDVQVQVNLDAKKRSAEHQFEVVLKLKIDSKASCSCWKWITLAFSTSKTCQTNRCIPSF